VYCVIHFSQVYSLNARALTPAPVCFRYERIRDPHDYFTAKPYITLSNGAGTLQTYV